MHGLLVVRREKGDEDEIKKRQGSSTSRDITIITTARVVVAALLLELSWSMVAAKTPMNTNKINRHSNCEYTAFKEIRRTGSRARSRGTNIPCRIVMAAHAIVTSELTASRWGLGGVL